MKNYRFRASTDSSATRGAEPDLWVQLLQQMGLEVDKFGTNKKSSLPGLDA